MDATKRITKNLGGERLGSGNKMAISMHAYDRSSHNLSRAWRSTMNCGTLVPCFSEPALPGETWSIDTEAIVRTVPAIGPLYGSFKMQLDFFQCPIRLYNGLLHNNMTKIGMNMEQVKLPKMTLRHDVRNRDNYTGDFNTSQIAPDALINYLGLSGIGMTNDYISDKVSVERKIQCIPVMAYWDIYKNYYANKQEEIGAYIGIGYSRTTTSNQLLYLTEMQNRQILRINFKSAGESTLPTGLTPIENEYQELESPYPVNKFIVTTLVDGDGWGSWNDYYRTSYQYRTIVFDGDQFNVENLQLVLINPNGYYTLATLQQTFEYVSKGRKGISIGVPRQAHINDKIVGVCYKTQTTSTATTSIQTFPLQNIDDARIAILQNTGLNNELNIENLNIPYKPITQKQSNGNSNNYYRQFGLALKTYQSDMLNNWLKTEWIDGPSGINTITAVDVSSGSFTIDALNLANRVYNMLNRIAVSGGSYEDWVEAVYSTEAMRRAETPIYIGGMSSEVVFQEVVNQTQNDYRALGAMAGKGTTTNAKGGHIEVRIDEPSYIIGIVSLTPRIDNSQRNRWDLTELDTMADLHKPALDGIGFEDLLQERAAWFGTYYDTNDAEWKKLAMGKTPAWINYMTAINETHGDFAIEENAMFMTLNRNYTKSNNILPGQQGIEDRTTYIEPTKYNYAFADATLDAQNFWVQIGMRVESRRVMSAKIMPNL